MTHKTRTTFHKDFKTNLSSILFNELKEALSAFQRTELVAMERDELSSHGNSSGAQNWGTGQKDK